MTQVEGPNSSPINPSDKLRYEKEYLQSVDLFQRALNEYNKTDDMYKKEAFKEVMDKAMQVLNETARELKRTDLVAQNQKISQSYEELQEQKADAVVVSKNLNQAKKTV